jgi:hypothetical protein
VSSWVVAVVGEMLDELDVGEASSLWEAVRAGSNFH